MHAFYNFYLGCVLYSCLVFHLFVCSDVCHVVWWWWCYPPILLYPVFSVCACMCFFFAVVLFRFTTEWNYNTQRCNWIKWASMNENVAVEEKKIKNKAEKMELIIENRISKITLPRQSPAISLSLSLFLSFV